MKITYHRHGSPLGAERFNGVLKLEDEGGNDRVEIILCAGRVQVNRFKSDSLIEYLIDQQYMGENMVFFVKDYGSVKS